MGETSSDCMRKYEIYILEYCKDDITDKFIALIKISMKFLLIKTVSLRLRHVSTGLKIYNPLGTQSTFRTVA